MPCLVKQKKKEIYIYKTWSFFKKQQFIFYNFLFFKTIISFFTDFSFLSLEFLFLGIITLCGPHVVVQFLIIPLECWDSQYCWSWVSTRQNFWVCARRKTLEKSFNISHIFGIKKNTNKYFFFVFHFEQLWMSIHWVRFLIKKKFFCNFWSVSLELLLEQKPLNSEECVILLKNWGKSAGAGGFFTIFS